MNYLMMVGIPTSGKSTYVNNLLKYEPWRNAVVLSTDNFIEQEAKNVNSTYDELFGDLIKPATKKLNKDLDDAVRNRQSIIHDQTNLTQKTRAKKLARIPSFYQKIAVYTIITFTEALQRNKNRPGKVISERDLSDMLINYQIPTKDEGFDLILKITDPCELS